MKGNGYITLKYKELNRVNKRIEHSKKEGGSWLCFPTSPCQPGDWLGLWEAHTLFSPPLRVSQRLSRPTHPHHGAFVYGPRTPDNLPHFTLFSPHPSVLVVHRESVPVDCGVCELNPSTDSLLKVSPPEGAETRKVIEKLARFVAEGGPELEKVAMENHKDNPAFS